jgi:D-cysteine desulfhydrase
MPNKLRLANTPTPLFRHDALDALVGTAVWVKRDDMTAGPEAGNKIRKLEYLLCDARERGAQAVITCGGLQSNHARATALAARQLGLRTVLLLRTAAPGPATQLDSGNAFLDALVGAEVRLITPDQYRVRDALMRDVALELEGRGERAYVIPEGGSSGLGALGYVDAMGEVRAQLDAGEAGAPSQFDAVVHACGSGGTAAGVSLGASLHGIAPRTLAMAVCDDSAYFESVIGRLIASARTLLTTPARPNALHIIDEFKGPAYAVASPEQARFISRVARACGLILDPVYTGKALFGLAALRDKPARALFIHTGGLPGLLAQCQELLPFAVERAAHTR